MAGGIIPNFSNAAIGAPVELKTIEDTNCNWLSD